MVFHAFDSHEFPVFDALRFEDFTESAFAFLGYESVFCLAGTVHQWGNISNTSFRPCLVLPTSQPGSRVAVYSNGGVHVQVDELRVWLEKTLLRPA